MILKSPVSLRRKSGIVSHQLRRMRAAGVGSPGFKRGSLAEEASRATRLFVEKISPSHAG